MLTNHCAYLLPLTLFALSACGRTASGTPAPPQTPAVSIENGAVHVAARSRAFLDVQPVQTNRAAPAVRAPARVAFRDGAVARVAAPIAGRVATIHVKVGDHVKSGDPLVALQSPEAAAIRADLDTAAVARKAAQAAVDRQTDMLQKGVGIESEKLQAETELAKTRADVGRTERAAAYLGAGSGSTVEVRAPIDGTVLQRKTTVGAVADPNGEALIEIGDPSALWVVADVFERDLPLIKPGAECSVELAAVPTPMHGRVAAVGSALNDGLRTAPVYVSLDDSGVTLRAGMFARATITSEVQSGVDLPVTAVLVKDGKRSIVYVERSDHSFEPRDVTVAQPIEGHVQVLAGVSPGERVVMRGALLLDEAAEQLL